MKRYGGTPEYIMNAEGVFVIRALAHETLILIPSSINGGKFGESNAARLDACAFVVRFPRKSLLSKKRVTSGTV